jgi:hypothetical protein
VEINEITETIIGAAIAVHRDLGPGLLGGGRIRSPISEESHF